MSGGDVGPAWLADAPQEASAARGVARVERRYRHDAEPLDPALIRDLAGIDILKLMMAGEAAVSAHWQTAGVEIVDVAPGAVTLTARAELHTLNFAGRGHGGWIATLLDTAMGLSVMATLPKGRSQATVEMSVRFLRAVPAGPGLLRTVGRVVHTSRRLATAEARLEAEDGRPHALATATFALLDIG